MRISDWSSYVCSYVLKRVALDRIATDAGIAGMNSPAEVITKLLNLEEGLLEQIFAWTVADSILVDINDSTVDIFDALGTDIMAGWRIEENYLKPLSTAQVRDLADRKRIVQGTRV